MGNKMTAASLFDHIAQDNEVIQYFKHHSIRVMYLATMLAKRVGCFDEDIQTAALLHDIGKMGLAKEILLKNGKLTPLEKRVVESHSHIGNVIVRKELGKVRAAGFIRDHHEDWEGNGYPRGLAGEEISIQGRIIRICDSFDVMTYDDRNYRTAKMTYQVACEELRRCSWRQYDGHLVEEFISLTGTLKLSDTWYTKVDDKFLREIYTEIDGIGESLRQ